MQIHASASAEDYLETILLLSQKTKTLRAIDIVGEMGFSKPSVSIAMKKLRESDLVVTDNDGFIHLTEKGQAVAQQVYERHCVLFEWLLSLGVGEAVAAADACKLEHVLSEETFCAIKRNLKTLPSVSCQEE